MLIKMELAKKANERMSLFFFGMKELRLFFFILRTLARKNPGLNLSFANKLS